MTLEAFTCDSSPVNRADDCSLDITALSLPESFNDTFCFDIYNLTSETKQNRDRYTSATDQQSDTQTNSPSQEASATQHEEMEAKIRHLLSVNLELREKGRLFGNLETRCSDQEAELEELTTKLGEQVSLHELSTLREKELEHQVLELKRMNKNVALELENSQNEVALLYERVEKSEKDRVANAKSIKSLQAKYDGSISRHASEREELKREMEAEITKVRTECGQEITISRELQSEAFAREAELLRDAKVYALKQVESLRQELKDNQSKDAEKADVIHELEYQLADVRSDLKVRMCELNTLQASYDRTIEEANQLKMESGNNKHELHQMQTERAKLDKEYTIEVSRLQEIIRQKEEMLEIYHHDDLLIDNNGCGQTNDSIAAQRNLLVKNSVSLAQKCRELQSLLRQSMDELKIEKEKSASLANQVELSITTDKNSYILAAVSERDVKISYLDHKVEALQNELKLTVQERDYLALKLTEILERRHDLESMKELVDKGLRQMKFAPSKEDLKALVCYECKKLQEANANESENLLEHIVYQNRIT